MSNRRALAWVPLAVLGGLGVASAQETFALSPRAYTSWKITLPTETWHSVSAQIPILHAQAEGFSTIVDGPNLLVDTDADGDTDDKVKGARGFVKLRGRTRDGEPILTGIRFRQDGGWKYAVSGAMVGTVHGVKVQLIDTNLNGRFDEYGRDAMVVGSDKGASFLSRVVNLKGDLYTIEVSTTGHSIKATPYAKESGTLDLRSKFKSRGKLVSVVVSDDSGELSFNLASGSLKVPAGSYKITGGLAAKSSETVRIRAGNMKPLAVENDKEVVLEWGGPVTLDLPFSFIGEELKANATQMRYFGAAGEEYFDWVPNAKSPKIIVRDSINRKELVSGRFNT